MELSSSNSSDCTHVGEHELEQSPPSEPPQSLQLENAAATRSRVRINSVAAEIPPSPMEERPSFGHISEAESLENANVDDQTIAAAEQLLRAHNAGASHEYQSAESEDPYDESEYAVTGHTQGGVFYQLLQAYKNPLPAYNESFTSSQPSGSTPPTAQQFGSSSGGATPSRKKWHNKEKTVQSQETLATLIGASAKLANPNTKKEIPMRPAHKRTNSGLLSKMMKAKQDQDVRIKIHVANILKRQQYIIRMCRALMLFGAPTHRLEEYLATTAKVLEINSQFLYIPGCMLISFDDALTRKLYSCIINGKTLTWQQIPLKSRLYVQPKVSILVSSRTLMKSTKRCSMTLSILTRPCKDSTMSSTPKISTTYGCASSCMVWRLQQ